MEGEQSCNVLIIGGGPAGLATALMLAKRGETDIVVLEKRPSADYSEPDKSFNYSIDGRGQKLIEYLGLMEQLKAVGVPSTDFYITRIDAKGKSKTIKLPQVDSKRKTAYWLPRKTFLSLLDQEIQRNWQNQIKIQFETDCLKIEREPLQVLARSGSGEILKFFPRLLVGCDGLHSVVRQTLEQWEGESSDRFKMQEYPSPSSGLRYKVLTLPPQFHLDPEGNQQSICEMAYSIRGGFREPQKAISLGLLPVKNPSLPRTANLITNPDHQLWTLKSGEQVLDFLVQAFSQLPIKQIVSSQEAERFARSNGGRFPIPQYCRGVYWLSSQPVSEQGVILFGDAVHCFPPDIGQGVNSALEDIEVFRQVLAQNDHLAQALPEYEIKRAPDTKALVQLAQVAYPWQYNQNPWGRRLWSINFFLRLALSRFLPVLISPPAFFLIQDEQLQYHEIWQKAQRTTWGLSGLGLVLIGYLLMRELMY